MWLFSLVVAASAASGLAVALELWILVAVPMLLLVVLWSLSGLHRSLAAALFAISVIGTAFPPSSGPGLRVSQIFLLCGLISLVAARRVGHPQVNRSAPWFGVILVALLARGILNDFAYVAADIIPMSIGVVVFLLARPLKTSELRFLELVLAWCVIAACFKASLIALWGGTISAGPTGLLQVYQFPTSIGSRTIMVGADTFFVVLPGFFVGARRLRQVADERMVFIVAAVAGLIGTLLTQTRSNILVCVVFLVYIVIWGGSGAASPGRGRQVLYLSLLAGFVLTTLRLGFFENVAPRAFRDGLSISSSDPSAARRTGEIQAIGNQMNGIEPLVGKGLGGTYDLNGVTSEWSHNIVAYMYLKGGLLLLAIAAVAIVGGLRFCRVARQRGGAEVSPWLGVIVAMAALSLTTNRFASADGSALLALAFAALGAPRSSAEVPLERLAA